MLQYVDHSSAGSTKASWGRAYLRFLAAKDERLLLKVAPLALLGVLPIDTLSNLIPVLGFFDDAGYLIATLVVVSRTITRVHKYR